MLRMKTGYPQSPERDQQKRYVLCCQLKAILGSWHSTTELLPHSGIQPHYSTSICTCVLYLDHFQQGPAGQRGGLVVQFKNTMRRVLGNGGFEPIALP
jgi:hypothetical protein